MTRGICPFAVALLIPPPSNDPPIKPRVAILHVDAGNAFSLFRFFRDRSGGIESHFHIRADGVIEQYRNIFWQADANREANDFAVSIETQGFGAGKWNDKQLASIRRLLLWLNAETAGAIPLQKCTGPFGSGIGYHTQWGSPSAWTPVAKSCPGPERIRQYHDVVVPWLNTNPAARAAEQEEEDAMWEKVLRRWHPVADDKGSETAGGQLAQARGFAGAGFRVGVKTRADVKRLEAKVDRLTDVVEKLAERGAA